MGYEIMHQYNYNTPSPYSKEVETFPTICLPIILWHEVSPSISAGIPKPAHQNRQNMHSQIFLAQMTRNDTFAESIRDVTKLELKVIDSQVFTVTKISRYSF